MPAYAALMRLCRYAKWGRRQLPRRLSHDPEGRSGLLVLREPKVAISDRVTTIKRANGNRDLLRRQAETGAEYSPPFSSLLGIRLADSGT